MFTLALAARYVDEQLGEPGRIAELGAKFTKPVVVPESGTEVEIEGTWRDERTIALRGHLRRRDRARQPGGGPAWLSAGSGWPTTPRCGWAVRRRTGSAPPPRTSWSTPYAGATRPASRSSCWPAAATSWWPTRASTARSSRSRPPASRADHEGDDPTCGGVVVTVAAGEPWDPFVAHAVERRWVGIEALSGIPGSVGATPIQNVGAYGQEVSQTLASVRVWDRHAPRHPHLRRRRLRLRLPHQQVQGRPRPARRPRGRPSSSARASSARRSSTPSWPAPSGSSPARARRWPTYAVRCSTCAGARGWSSTPTTTTPGAPARSSPTRSSPPTGCPRSAGVAAARRLVKTSAAWLIERAGFGKGYGDGAARLSTKHTLALTNRGGATTADLLALGPRDPRRGRAALRRSGWSTSRCWSAASSKTRLARKPLLIRSEPVLGAGRGSGRRRRSPRAPTKPMIAMIPSTSSTCR